MTTANYNSQQQTQPTPRKLVLERVFDAPRELVFKAWTDPKMMARWWGPTYFTNPVCELDARPGGAILIHMTSPDGTAYPMKGTFEEVVPPERLAFSAIALEDEAGKGSSLATARSRSTWSCRSR